MIEDGTILIGLAGGDHVSIMPGKKGHDEWLGAQIEVHCDCWSGRMQASFMKGELAHFGREVRELHRKLVGNVEFHACEGNIILALSGDGKGHIAVNGKARNDCGSGTELIFRFEIDQTFLKGIAEALAHADPD